MQTPFEMQHAAAVHPNPLRRMASLGIVGVLHLALLYALVNSMTHGTLTLPRTIIDVIDLPKEPPPKPVDPVNVKMIEPTEISVKPPIFDVQNDTDRTITLRRDIENKVQPPPAPPTTAQSIGATHTTPPYPTFAIRLGQQGTVILRLAVGTDGTVDNATVEQSSGAALLDEAAVNWVKAHWRYKPATRDGQPISAIVQAAIRFDLKTAR